MTALRTTLIGTALLTLASTSAMANQELATKKACLACHAIDKKVVGPAYQDVAAKYKGKKGIEAVLAQKIMKGSDPKALNWGTMPMPANAQVNDAEAKQLVTWILSLKK
jgi:cytochrome c